MSNQLISFDYRKQNETCCTKRTLTNWKEVGFYIEGVDITDHKVKTFRKDRVERYYDNAESWLSDPFGSPPPRLKKTKSDDRPHIIFTGFPQVQRAALEAKALENGLRVCSGVTKNCEYLVGGPNAGWKKISDARSAGAYILSESQFHELLATGELPDDPDGNDYF